MNGAAKTAAAAPRRRGERHGADHLHRRRTTPAARSWAAGGRRAASAAAARPFRARRRPPGRRSTCAGTSRAARRRRRRRRMLAERDRGRPAQRSSRGGLHASGVKGGRLDEARAALAARRPAAPRIRSAASRVPGEHPVPRRLRRADVAAPARRQERRPSRQRRTTRWTSPSGPVQRDISSKSLHTTAAKRGCRSGARSGRRDCARPRAARAPTAARGDELCRDQSRAGTRPTARRFAHVSLMRVGRRARLAAGGRRRRHDAIATRSSIRELVWSAGTAAAAAGCRR